MVDKVSILLVDDDVEDQSIIADAIEALDPTLTLYFEKSGIEALKRLEELHERESLPCLLVIDLNMPKMGGAEMLTLLKADERLKYIPVIIYSTSNNATEKAACLRMGARDYISKPLSYNESIDVARLFINTCHALTKAAS